VPANAKLLDWLRVTCSGFRNEVVALYKTSGKNAWPLSAADDADLVVKLEEGGHLLPLPKEPAALANILEVSIVDFILDALRVAGGAASRGTERGYPDIEFHGPFFGGGFHAIDVKIAMRKKKAKTAKKPKGATQAARPTSSKHTQSRITLYTGNTYFRYPQLHWPGTFRAFDDYESHLDVIGIYTLDEQSMTRVDALELIVQEPWKIASRQRSSTTREYLGAVTEIERLRKGDGEFKSEKEFYDFWRKFNFKIGRAVQKQLDRLLAKHSGGAP
jgi:hypothetical protein